MHGGAPASDRIDAALAALGPGALDAERIRAHVAPLFSRALARNASHAYLANHSLGRPLDAMEDDVRQGLAAWYAHLGGAWEAWGGELAAYRARLARLLGAPRPDCVVPRTSAGQGLRAVLNSFGAPPAIVATRGEFDSLDVVLREYAHRGRARLTLVDANADGEFDAVAIRRAIVPGADLVVLSHVMFQTGQVLPGLGELVAHAHASGALVLLDVYHSLGVLPVDVGGLGVDFAVGGAYKYLRGGPGACYLYVSPGVLASRRRTLDIGWFAKEAPFDYARPDPPRLAGGGDAWMESTPAVLTWYQARSGQRFVLGMGVERLREHSLRLQRRLVELLRERGIAAIGGTPDRGAFVVVRRDDAVALADRMIASGVDVDARGRFLRLCPDVLTTDGELARAADALAAACRG
ncbi:MAG: aminotransferase class V-fold PLP-dependent enzyme [Betaproteobacteria bacterium]|nr:aminotransferase class V-fold PLP-dependent enzyme [Betaproteobacteria bacterium]